MNRTIKFLTTLCLGAMLLPVGARAQYKDDVDTTRGDSTVVVLTLEDALKIALSENVPVKVADLEVERTQYAKKGTYAALFPQITASGSYQRTIKKQVMYMDNDDGGGMASMFTSIFAPIYTALSQLSEGTGIPVDLTPDEGSMNNNNSGGISVGRWNTFNGGVSATLPLVNFQLWKSIAISGDAVELAVEQARSSRLDMVTQVKQAFYAVLLAKEVFEVYKSVYENAVDNFGQTEKRFKAQKASELEYTRAKVNVANAIPNVYTAESQIIIALWQLKAVMGVDLDMDVEVAGSLSDYSTQMFRDIHENDDVTLEHNTTMRQLAIQAEQLAETIKLQKYAFLPTLTASFSYSQNAMTNDFHFNEFQWTPYSFVGLNLSIPIFTGGKRIFDVKQARIQADKLDLQRVNTERQLKIAIRQHLTTMEANMKNYDTASEAVALARKAYDVQFKSYSLGKSTLTDLNDSQLALTQSALSQSQAVYNFLVAKSNLEQILGHDFINEEGEVDLDNM